MHSADALYGVTMGNEGLSKLLSVKFGNDRNGDVYNVDKTAVL